MTEELIHAAVRDGTTIARKITPVLHGLGLQEQGRAAAARRRRAATCRARPRSSNVRHRPDDERGAEVALTADPDRRRSSRWPSSSRTSRYGQLTYIRIYQGTLAKGDTIVNTPHRQRKVRGRPPRAHARRREGGDRAARRPATSSPSSASTAPPATRSPTAEIYSLDDARCTCPSRSSRWRSSRKDDKPQDNMSKALSRFAKEDPTFRVRADEETGETIIAGMGELHLDIYVERMRREYKRRGRWSARRRSPTARRSRRRVEFNYTHKKQTGGSGQYAHASAASSSRCRRRGGRLRVRRTRSPAARSRASSSRSCDKGFQQCLRQGRRWPASRSSACAMTLDDGAYHAVDSSRHGLPGRRARRLPRGLSARPGRVMLEPIMKVEVEAPERVPGRLVGDLNQRRGIIIGTHRGRRASRVDRGRGAAGRDVRLLDRPALGHPGQGRRSRWSSRATASCRRA